MKEIPKNVLNRRENEKIFTGWRNGDWWENGICNPRKSFKDAGIFSPETVRRRAEKFLRDLRD